jgi:hypothetical protein
MFDFIKKNVIQSLKESASISYDDVLKKQQQGSPAYDLLFSNEDAEFIEEKINIEKLRTVNGFNNDPDDELEQTVSYFEEVGMDEDYFISRKLMNKIVDGVELSPIVVDENYKILDGNHRLAAYSELWFYHGYDFPFNGMLKIYKRVKN